MSDKTKSQTNPKGNHLYTMMLGAIGVVYGDIGTSPLYTMREAFMPEHSLQLTELNIMGILSLILWSLIIIVSIKYVMLVMRADNRGEGGILALTALAQRAVQKKSLVITSLGIIGAALFYGDGIITPAISVLSAVEGLQVATHAFDQYIVGIAVAILVLLFWFQRHGSDLIGRLFGPITCVWFIALGALGIYHIAQNPEVLWAFSPFYAIHFFFENSTIGLMVLGTVVLCVTGAEALYADMGHFGFKPIRMAWLYFVMPCLMLNYMGQGALLLKTPEALENPFYKMVPTPLLYPMVVLATLATVIASQAMISGAYTITQQAIRLDLLPRMKIMQTSAKHIGQIYMPQLNSMMFIGVILLVVWFHSSSALASAYGIAVTGTMLITSILVFIVSWKLWKWPLWKTILVFVPLLINDAAFFSATLTKLTHGIGAWIPLVLGATIYLVMMTWNQGKQIKIRRNTYGKERIETLINHIRERQITRLPGTAVYLSRDLEHVPVALATNMKHYRAVHENVIIACVQTLDEPRVPESGRLEVIQHEQGFTSVLINYGFMQQANVPRALGHLPEHKIEWDSHDVTYFMSRFRVVSTPRDSGMSMWREKLYALMHRNSSEASDFFHLPPNRVLEIGSPVTI